MAFRRQIAARRSLGQGVNFAGIIGGGVRILQASQSDIGVTDAGSALCSQWNDYVGGLHWTAAGGARPLIVQNGCGTRPCLRFDGVAQTMASTLTLPAPGTTPTWFWIIFKQISWTNTEIILGDGAATTNMRLMQATSEPNVRISSNAANGALVSAATGSWMRAYGYYSDSTADYLKVGSASVVTGVNTGGNGTTGRTLAARGGPLLLANVDIAAVMHCNADPGSAVHAALDAAIPAWCGAGVVTV